MVTMFMDTQLCVKETLANILRFLVIYLFRLQIVEFDATVPL
jgi:hypothetical protein